MFNKIKLGLNRAGEFTVGKVIGVVVLDIIALSLLPTIVVYVSAAQNSTSGASDTMLGLVTLFYVLAVAVANIMIVVHEVGKK
jgi:hypothetical protein